MSTQLVTSAALAVDIPLIFWGPPGTGKTSGISDWAAASHAHLIPLIGSYMDSTDIGGQPVPDASGNLRISPAPFAVEARRLLDLGRRVWIFLDEVSCAPEAVQAGFLRLVQERWAGVVNLEGIRILAAANPADTAADGGWLSPAMAGRFLHVDWKVDPSQWAACESSGDWASENFTTLEPPSEARLRAARALVSGWILRSPSSLVPTRPDTGELRGWPAPRTWSAVSRFLAALARDGDIRAAALSPAGVTGVSGLIGNTESSAFITWVEAMDLPDVEEYLEDPSRALPGRADQVATILLGVVSAACSQHKDRKQRVAAAWKVLSRVRPDIALIPGRTLLSAGGVAPAEAQALGDAIINASK